MLLKCSACNSRYLVNSADLKPKGRTVRCVTCNYEWFQEPNFVNQDVFESSDFSTEKKENNKLDKKNEYIANLPSTYIKEEKTSILNSFLLVFFLFLIITSVWFFKNDRSDIFAVLNYYIQEFYFNLMLIIDDIILLIQHIIN